MIYEIEDYYRACDAAGGHASLLDRLRRDRVTMAIILASASSHKQETKLGPLLKLFEAAGDADALSVYVDVYGRPVSYVLCGYSKLGERDAEPLVWFGPAEDADSLYLVDLVVSDGCADETFAMWLAATEHEAVTVRRRHRPSGTRTYRTKRLKSFNWRVAQIADRFGGPAGHGMAEHEAASIAIVDQFSRAISVLTLVLSETGIDPFIGQAVSLVFDLLSLGQCRAAFAADGRCEAAIFMALCSPGSRLLTGDLSKALDASLSDFVDGDELALLGMLGSASVLLRLRRELDAELISQREDGYRVVDPFKASEPGMIPSSTWRTLVGSPASRPPSTSLRETSGAGGTLG